MLDIPFMNENISLYRRLAIQVAVGSLTLAAFAGILAILIPNSIGDTGFKVIGTTFTVGIFAIVELCYLVGQTTFNRFSRSLGTVFASATAVKVLLIIWVDSGADDHFQILGTTAALSIMLAQNNLLQASVSNFKKKNIEYFLSLTIGISLLLTALVISLIWEIIPDTQRMQDNGARAVASLLILDVLGVLVILILGMFGSKENKSSLEPEIKITLPLELKNKILTAHPEQTIDSVVVHLLEEKYGPEIIVDKEAVKND